MGGKYLLGEPIGAGGMGLVFRAVQPELQREVAIKILRAELVDDDRMVRHFRREALAAARVSHPGLVGMFDVGATADGRPFLVMEHVRGCMLSAMIGESLLALDRACDVVAQLLAALAEVHRAGIVHADVKSDNVMVETTHDGRIRARLLDFGLACIAPLGPQYADDRVFEDERALDDGSGRYVSGTPAYMAPEVIEGHPPTAASDLYGVGVVLYELLTGTVPFGGDSAVVILMRHLTEPPVAPSLRQPERGIPRALEEVVARALEKAPEDRFADADAFAAALAAARAPATQVGRTFAPRRPPPRPRLARGSRPAIATHEHRVRCAIADGIATGDVEEVTRGYLDLAHLLAARGDRRAAIRELIEAHDVVSGGGATDGRVAIELERLRAAMLALWGRGRRSAAIGSR